MNRLVERRCAACNSETPRIAEQELSRYLAEVEGFEVDPAHTRVEKIFEFKDFPETMLFVNAVAAVAHREDHHPDLEVGYKTCKVRFTTHAVGGLTENDFISAAKVNALLA
ncbi:MAG: 4a-hydroxytetrahydrobiopterin dehydratase [Myxococcota bacterium]